MYGFATPEEAALAEWRGSPSADVQVISVEYLDENRAVVITDTHPSHPMRSYFTRSGDGWTFGHDHMAEGWAGGCECDA